MRLYTAGPGWPPLSIALYRVSPSLAMGHNKNCLKSLYLYLSFIGKQGLIAFDVKSVKSNYNMGSRIKVFEGNLKKNQYKGTLCLSVCTTDPQKVIGIIREYKF